MRRPAARRSRSTRTGSYVQWTTRASTNTLVTRFSIPDSADGTGNNATLDVYVNGTFLQAINLTSHYSWLYGDETSPTNTPSAGTQRHIYDEANTMLSHDGAGRQHDQAPEGLGQLLVRTRSTSSTPSRSRRSPTPTPPSTSRPPGSASRTCRTRWTRCAWTPPATWSASTCRPASTRPRPSSRSTARPSRSSAPGPGTPSSTRPPRRTTPTSASARTGDRERFVVLRLRWLRQLHLAHRRPRQGLRPHRRLQHHHRQHLDRAHGLRDLGHQRRPV